MFVSEFIERCKKGPIEYIKEHVDQFWNETSNNERVDALEYAIIGFGDASILDFLLLYGFEFIPDTGSVFSPYKYVCTKKDLSYLKVLVKHGVPIPEDCLNTAFFNCDYSMVEYLLNTTNVRMLTGDEFRRSMSDAKITIIKLLIDYGFDYNCDDGQTIYTAVSYGYIEIARMLLDIGMKVDLERVLLCAIRGHQFDVCHMLIDRGADIESLKDEHRYDYDMFKNHRSES
jgi:hypothetical protein